MYLTPRMLLLTVLGFSSGLPILLVFSTLSVWLTEVGVDKSTVGAFALASTPYTFKFLWAPLVDQLRLPRLSGWLGRRRSWMLLSQLALAGLLIALAASNPFGVRRSVGWVEFSASLGVRTTALLALAVAALSATQDIVLDAYRVEVLDRSEQAAGSAVFVFGYRLGMLFAGAGALYLSTYFENGGGMFGLRGLVTGLGIRPTPWALTYICMAMTMGVGMIATLLAPEKPLVRDERPAGTFVEAAVDVFERAVVGPLRAFVTRRPSGLWALVLLFVLLFKLSDALAAVLRNPFLIDIGFQKTQIANIAQTYGMVASIVGALLGGWLVKAAGLKRSLWLSLVLMIVSNLLFAAQSQLGADAGFLVATITVENLTGGFGTAAFVAYLSLLCDVRFTATQYALLTSLSSVGRTMVGASTGFYADTYGWTSFFVMTAIAGIPALAVLGILHWFGKLGTELTE